MGKIIVYRSEDGKLKLDVDLENETLWLNQDQLSKLFATDRSSVAKHIKNILADGELEPEQTCAKIAQVLGDKRVYSVMHYNLDMVISVGYRVNSVVATRYGYFRRMGKIFSSLSSRLSAKRAWRDLTIPRHPEQAQRSSPRGHWPSERSAGARGSRSGIDNPASLLYILITKTLRPEFAFLRKTRRSFLWS